MKAWFEAHLVTILLVVFTSGVAYSNIAANRSKIDEFAPHVNQVPLLKMQVSNHQESLNLIVTETNRQYREVLQKLDELILRLEKRDTAYLNAISDMKVEVGVLREKVK